MTETEDIIKGGRSGAQVYRVGDTIRRRSAVPNTLAPALLKFLESTGFKGTPRFLGIDSQGRDMLSYIPGVVPTCLGHYDDPQLAAAASLMREFHDATASFPDRAGCEVICHNDWAPPNCVFDGTRPIGMIDFDTLTPGPRLWDLGYSAHTFLNLGNGDYGTEEQLRRLRLFASAYGLEESRLTELVVHITARLTSCARWAGDIGSQDITEWAKKSRDWVATHLLDRLIPSHRGRFLVIREADLPSPGTPEPSAVGALVR